MNSATRNFLRKRAHDLKPIVMVGKQGADERISQALDEALSAHELIKLRFQDFHDEQRQLAETLATGVGAQVVSIVGHVAIIFRQNEDKDKQLIHIPKTITRE